VRIVKLSGVTEISSSRSLHPCAARIYCATIAWVSASLVARLVARALARAKEADTRTGSGG